MIGEFGRMKFMAPLVAGAMLSIVGCSGGGDDTPTPATPTPTPTPTPVPPVDDYFRVTTMAVGDSSVGVDLNDDGEIDNGIEGALEEITTTILDAVEAALVEAEVAPAQIQAVLAAVEQILNSVFTVDALSEAINAPIEAGDRNYLMNFKESSTGMDLNWYLGAFKNTGYTLGANVGTQAGSLDASGNGLFGPGALTLSLSFESPTGEGDPTEIELVLEAGITSVEGYNGTLINDAIAGGAITIDFLTGLVESALVAVNEALENIPSNPNGGGEPIVIPVDEIVTQLETALTEQADLDLDNDSTNDSFSIGLIVNADVVTIVQ